MINQEITILDGVGLPVGLPDGEAGIKTSYSPTGALIGAELGNISSTPCRRETHMTISDYEMMLTP